MNSLEKEYEMAEWHLVYLEFKKIIVKRLEKYPEQKEKWENSLERLERWYEDIKKTLNELYN